MENAALALTQARYVQRDSWRHVAVRSTAPPIGASSDLLDGWNNENILFEGGKSIEEPCDERRGLDRFGRNTGNPLSVVRIGQENLLVCALSGLLDSVALFDVRISTDPDGYIESHIFRRGPSVPSSDAVFHDTSPITDIVVTDWESESSEPGRLLVTTKTSLSFANICVNGKHPAVDWVDQFSFPAVLSCALNPLYPTEFAAISTEGLFFGSPQDYVSRRDRGQQHFHDIQVLARECVYNRVFFGPFPRSLLLSSRREVARFDIRARVDKDSRDVLFDVRKHWNLPWHDCGITVFKPLRTRGHMMFVATQTCVNFFDIRMPSNPLLDWSMSLPLPVEQACTAQLTTQGTRSEVIALASRKQSYLEIFHAVHDESQIATEFSPFQADMLGGKGRNEWKPPAVSKRSLFWSDLPLTHMQQLSGKDHVSGMALVALSDDKQVSLIQWSAMDGLIGQLLDVKVGQDGEADFEDVDVAERTQLGTSVAMQDFQRRLWECGEYRDRTWYARPVSKMPGSMLHERTKRLYLSDVRELRPCILRDDDDDTDETGFVRLPRPFLANIPLVAEIRHRSGDRKITSTGSDHAFEDGGERVQRLEGMEQKARKLLVGSSDGVKHVSEMRPIQAEKEGLAQAGDNVQMDGLEAQASRSVTGNSFPAVKADAGESERMSSDLSDVDMEEDGAMSGLLGQIGSGKMLNEIGRVVRSGIGHNATPLGAQELQARVEASGMVRSYDVEWHSLCMEDHAECRTAVSTNEGLPDWVPTRVYYTKEVRVGEALEKSNIGEESGYGKLLLKMKTLFVDEEDDDDR